MIKLNDHILELTNLKDTIRELQEIDGLLAIYTHPSDAPPCVVSFVSVGTTSEPPKVLFARKIMFAALRAQRNEIVGNLERLGIDASDLTQ